MTQLASVDYPNKRIHLHADTMTVGCYPITLYQEVFAEWLGNTASQNYVCALDAEGYEPKGGGLFTPRRALLSSTGWRLVPYDASHTLKLWNEILNKADSKANIDCFDRSGLSGGTEVNIDTTGIDKVEIVEVSTGDGLNAANQAKLDSIYAQTGNHLGAGVLEGSITYAEAQRLILALAIGNVEQISDDGTTRVLDFKDLAGTGVRFRSSGNKTTGARTVTNLDGE